MGTPVTSVAPSGPDGPVVVTAKDGETTFDAVLLATHSDISLCLLEGWAPKVGAVRARSARWGLLWGKAPKSAGRFLIVSVVVPEAGAVRSALAAPWYLPAPATAPAAPAVHAAQTVRDVLAAIPYNDNDVYLHTDASLMPQNRKTWASWNFLGSSGEGADG